MGILQPLPHKTVAASSYNRQNETCLGSNRNACLQGANRPKRHVRKNVVFTLPLCLLKRRLYFALLSLSLYGIWMKFTQDLLRLKNSGPGSYSTYTGGSVTLSGHCRMGLRHYACTGGIIGIASSESTLRSLVICSLSNCNMLNERLQGIIQMTFERPFKLKRSVQSGHPHRSRDVRCLIDYSRICVRSPETV